MARRRTPSFDIDFRMFFDRQAVTRRVDASKAKVLRGQGHLVMRKARGMLKVGPRQTLGSMSKDQRQRFRIRQEYKRRETGSKKGVRKPVKPALPGQPPHLHFGKSPLKTQLLFGYDPRRESVVIGPRGLGSSLPTVPEKLEYGRGGTPAHPYMGPSLKISEPQLAKFWKDAVT